MTTCLCMIVRNEAHVIERCLRSVLAAGIDYWVIADTGSTDGTQDRIRELLADVPGELHEDAWVNFAHNRTLVCERAKGRADWLVWIDADGTFEGTTRELPLPTESPVDGYAIHLTIAGSRNVMIRILRGDLDWEYEFELHEHVVTRNRTFGFYPHLTDQSFPDGARSKNPRKWLDDAAVLETMPKVPRNLFLLGQSYREAGCFDKAREAYLACASMATDVEEQRWIAQFYAGRMAGMLGDERAWAELLAAYSARPWRCEPLVDLARLCSAQGWDAAALVFAKQACWLVKPDREMFSLEEDAWNEGRWEEMMIALSHTGLTDEAFDVGRRLLDRDDVTETVKTRVRGYLRRLLDDESGRQVQGSGETG